LVQTKRFPGVVERVRSNAAVSLLKEDALQAEVTAQRRQASLQIVVVAGDGTQRVASQMMAGLS
jgi:hypothetical protein